HSLRMTPEHTRMGRLVAGPVCAEMEMVDAAYISVKPSKEARSKFYTCAIYGQTDFDQTSASEWPNCWNVRQTRYHSIWETILIPAATSRPAWPARDGASLQLKVTLMFFEVLNPKNSLRVTQAETGRRFTDCKVISVVGEHVLISTELSVKAMKPPENHRLAYGDREL
ncbi:15203_t:CDS:2, partial [Acaulospora morrowiae]